jgi:hypothetical protein
MRSNNDHRETALENALSPNHSILFFSPFLNGRFERRIFFCTYNYDVSCCCISLGLFVFLLMKNHYPRKKTSETVGRKNHGRSLRDTARSRLGAIAHPVCQRWRKSEHPWMEIATTCARRAGPFVGHELAMSASLEAISSRYLIASNTMRLLMKEKEIRKRNLKNR